MSQKWKTIKIRERDYFLIGALRENLREHGIQRLPDAQRVELTDGASAGSVVAAALTMLRDHLAGEALAEAAPAKRAKRRAVAK